MAAWGNPRCVALVSLLLLTFFEADFDSPCSSLSFSNYFPTFAFYRLQKKLLSDKETDTALALAAIAPSVLPIESATVTRSVSSLGCLFAFDGIH